MQQDYFKNINSIKFEGKESDNPLAYKYYDPDRKVMGKSLRDHFKFAMCYWHSMNDNGTDPFGRLTNLYPWNQEKDVLKQAKNINKTKNLFIILIKSHSFCSMAFI